MPSRESMTTFYIQQFGCRATQADGAALERQLLDRGCTQTPDPVSASIVVLNTCTVTAAADAQARDSIRKIHAKNPHARLIVTGCYAQRAPEELASLPGVTWVVGNSHKPQIPNLVTQIAAAVSTHATDDPTSDAHFYSRGEGLAPSCAPPLASTPHLGGLSEPAQILTGDIFAHPEFLSAPIQGGESHHTRPILKIQDGCNNRCSFCVIPHVRGKSRSLPPDQVICEIQSLVGRAPLSVFSSTSPAREIVLSGINLGTYGRDLKPRVAFIDLLRRILDETSIERLRLSSIEPQDVTQDLIDLFAQTERIAQHFHMPLQ